MSDTFSLEVVTPERRTFEGIIDQVTLPTLEGEITVLPNHVALITQLKPGELTFKKSGQISHLAVGGGFAHISKNEVRVLTDLAEFAEEISERETEEARRRAEEALKEKDRLSEEEYAAVAAALEHSLTKLKVRRKHHSFTTKPINP